MNWWKRFPNPKYLLQRCEALETTNAALRDLVTAQNNLIQVHRDLLANHLQVIALQDAILEGNQKIIDLQEKTLAVDSRIITTQELLLGSPTPEWKRS